MSFAKGKRFNEVKGCAPPVGAYDPKEVDKKKGAVILKSTTERFKEPKVITPGPGAFDLSSITPGKKSLNDTRCKLNSTCLGNLVSSASKRLLSQSSSISSSVESLSSKGKDKSDTNGGLCARCKLFSEQDSKDWAQSLKKCKEALQAQKFRLQEKLRELELDSWKKDDSIRFLKGEVSATNDHMLQGEQALFEANAEIAEYKEKLEQLEEQEKTVNENIRLLSEKYEVIEMQLAEEQSHGKERQVELQSRLEVTRSNLQEVEEDCVDLQRRNSDLLRSLHSEKDEVEKLIYQMDEQKKLSSDLGSLLDSKEEIITDLEIHLEATKIELQNTKDVAEKNTTDLQSLREKIAELESTEKSLENQLQEDCMTNNQIARSHADRIMELEQAELVLKEEAQQKDESFHSAVKRCESLEEQVERLTIQVNSIKEEFECTVSEVKRTKEKELQDLMETVDRVREEKNGLERRVAEQADEISARDDKVLLLSKEKECVETKMAANEVDHQRIIKGQIEGIENMNMKIETLCQEKLELLRQLEQVALDRDTVAQQLQETKESVAVTAAQKEAEWSHDLQRLTSDLKAITEEKEILDQKLSQATAQRTGLSEYVDEIKAELESQKRTVEEVTQKLSDNVVELTESRDSLQQHLHIEQTNCKSLQSENNSLMSEIDYLQKSSKQLKCDVTEEGKQHQKQVEGLSREKQRLESQIADIERQHSSLREEFTSSVTERSSALEKVTELTDQVAKLTDDLTVSQSARDSLMENVTVLGEKIIDLEEEIDSAKSVNVFLSNQVTGLTEQVTEMENNLESSEAKNQQFVSQVVELNIQLLDMRGQLDCSGEHNDSLTRQVSGLKVQVATLEEDLKSSQALLQVNTQEKSVIREELTSVRAEKEALSDQISGLASSLSTVEHEKKSFCKQADSLADKLMHLQSEYDTQSETVTALEGQLSHSHASSKAVSDKVLVLEENLKSSEVEIKAKVEEATHLKSYLSHLETEDKKNKECIVALQEQLGEGANKEELDQALKELEKWRKLYEDLQAKVEPFMEQLDAFELEKQALTGRSKNAQAEVDKLSKEYAKLLGHQNQKQKIHHIIKIKEENNTLKKEVSALREQCNKHKRTIGKMEDKVRVVEGKKRFDSSMAFSRSKENLVPPSSPLRDGNRH
ncbi:hyaluronan mediated motility receptor-like [Mizuhopecten yessoensis]|uniref:Hyaluronan mediated motility receptor n=1 Tax=Mizuhopecten yessoensis TaxID=6573 RepID=A0A210QE91_MIZYE|nr:hyaluronan mediated motility receptor-like [Mizuhopecten yessoensis]OWF47070.1 Hyaluronan mediated motility receptor [Mizuhopecten yessoensis]